MTPSISSVLPTLEADTEHLMYLSTETWARELDAARLAEAEHLRPGRLLTRAARLSRKAERAAYEARLALARVGA